MLNSILLYIVQNENEIPQQLVPNSGYYLIGREIRIVDNMGQVATFVPPQKANENTNANMDKLEQCEKRIAECENKIRKVYTYLSSFGGDKE